MKKKTKQNKTNNLQALSWIMLNATYREAGSNFKSKDEPAFKIGQFLGWNKIKETISISKINTKYAFM